MSDTAVITAGAAQRDRAELVRVALVLPLVVYLVVFYIGPVAAMLLRSVSEPHWTLANIIQVATDRVSLTVFWITFRTSLVVTVATVLIGYPVAFRLAQMRRPMANAALMLILLPFWTSVLVRSYAWMVLLGRNGVVNQFLLYAGAIDAPLRLLNTPLAVAIAMTHILLPYMILPTYSVLLDIDRALPRAASGLGASPFGVFRQVWLPLSMPGAAAGAMLVFVLSLGFFITPALVGGPRDMMIAMLIQQQVDLVHWPMASALAAALLMATLFVLALAHRVLGLDRLLRGARR